MYRFKHHMGILICCFLHPQDMALGDVSYERDVVPIIRDYCAGCHNHEEMEGDFSLETFQALKEGGETGATMVVPGQADNSFLIQVLTGKSKPKMPPGKEPQLDPGHITTLIDWIQAGAHGPVEAEDTSILRTLLLPAYEGKTEVQPIITASEISQDGRWIVRGGFGFLTVQTLPDEKEVWSTLDVPGKVSAVHIHGDQVSVASGVTGLRGEASIWNLRNGNRIQRMSGGHTDLLYDAEISPDGKTLATAGYDRTIRIWDIQSGAVTRTIKGHYGAIFDLAFHPQGKLLASASADQTLKLWRLRDGMRVGTLNQPEGNQNRVAFTPDGKYILGAGSDRRIRMWGSAERTEPTIHPLLRTRFGHEGQIVAMQITPDGKQLITSSMDRSIKVWSLPTLIQERAWESTPDVALDLSLHPSEQKFVAHLMNSLTLWHRLPSSKKNQDNLAKTRLPKVLPPQETSASKQSTLQEITSASSNLDWETAQDIPAPSVVKGRLTQSTGAAFFRFHAEASQEWVVEINADRSASPLDSHIAILDAGGSPVQRVRLQAVRDSWLTFRGKDSFTSGDFRLHNWREMELNEYLYANGEVVRLWLYPRGPDSGFLVYPGFGKRKTYFGTSAITHPLGEPCYIVKPLATGASIKPNGLPVFEVFYQNDDDPDRGLGKDSKLIFRVPKTGNYIIKLNDVRQFNGPQLHYTLTLRPREPGFKIRVEGWKSEISPNSGREFLLKVDRLDDYQGPVRIDSTHVPNGFLVSTPIVIQAEQHMAAGNVFLTGDKEATGGPIGLKASASIRGKTVEQALGMDREVKVGPPAKIQVDVLATDETRTDNGPLELIIHPGQTISARVRVQRKDFDGRIPFGGEDAGRNLPHGLYVDNIGLNGLMIVEGQTERTFSITAAQWVAETSRMFHIRTTEDGGQSSRPVLLNVRHQ
jgi:hypothetical protein